MSKLTPDRMEKLVKEAAAAAQNAYAPYSNFRVGAALLFDDGTITTGCNVENISYSLTICAERAALTRAIAEHGSGNKIVSIAVTNLNGAASPPCGACLQMLSEFVTPDAIISFPTESGIVEKPFRELLPFAFANWREEDHARR
jgi:cytidine deaminase